MVEDVVFVVVGKLSAGLTTSKVEPIARSEMVRTVYVFRESAGEEIVGVEYITIPTFVRKTKIIRHVFEFFQVLFFSLKLRPAYINGIYTLPQGLRSTVVAKLARCKSIISVIGGVIEVETYYKPSWFWKGLNLWMLRTCDVVTTTGTSVTAFLVRHGIKQKKIYELGGSVNTERFNASSLEQRSVDILFVGYFTELKGPDRVLEVVKMLKPLIPDVKAVFLGRGIMMPEIQSKIREYGLESNVFLPGYVPDVGQYYMKSKLLMMPSRTEGLSIAMLETMSCGCVPVVSNVGNMTDAAWHQENAMVVDDYLDIDGFYAASLELLENADKRKRLAVCGEKLVSEKYSVSVQSRVFDAMLGV